MCQITNNSNFTLSIENKNAVRNAAANMGIENVVIDEDFDSENDNIVSVFEEENEEGDSNFLFSLNTKTSEIE